MLQAPFFQEVFGVDWATLPPVMQKHYAVRPDSDDHVTVSGIVNIRRGWLMRLLSPLLKFSGMLVPYDGRDVPATVGFYSGPRDRSFHLDRQFYIPGRAPVRFHSRLEHVKGNEVIEFMRFGIGWRCAYSIHGGQVTLSHRGYVWRLGNFLLPLPLVLLLGKGAAQETAVDDDTFRMWMTITHPLFGESYRYEGTFKVTEVSLA